MASRHSVFAPRHSLKADPVTPLLHALAGGTVVHKYLFTSRCQQEAGRA